MFKAARAIRAFVEAIAGCPGRQHAILHQRGDFEDQSGMIRGDAQQPALVVAEMALQLGSDTIRDQRVRLALSQLPRAAALSTN